VALLPTTHALRIAFLAAKEALEAELGAWEQRAGVESEAARLCAGRTEPGLSASVRIFGKIRNLWSAYRADSPIDRAEVLEDLLGVGSKGDAAALPRGSLPVRFATRILVRTLDIVVPALRRSPLLQAASGSFCLLGNPSPSTGAFCAL